MNLKPTFYFFVKQNQNHLNTDFKIQSILNRSALLSHNIKLETLTIATVPDLLLAKIEKS